jgi:hypothetical protein
MAGRKETLILKRYTTAFIGFWESISEGSTIYTDFTWDHSGS